MAINQSSVTVEADPNDPTGRVKLRQAVDSVLGTMGAEGEPPSSKTREMMEQYVDGRLTMKELVDDILAAVASNTFQVADLDQTGDSRRSRPRRIIDSALGTVLAEGVAPGDAVIALSERYVAGEITLQELGATVRSISGI